IIFFFQAEDGIRGFHVTGVQTCALPIYLPALDDGAIGTGEGVLQRNGAIGTDDGGLGHEVARGETFTVRPTAGQQPPQRGGGGRSEERRVGRECRAQSSCWHSNV